MRCQIICSHECEANSQKYHKEYYQKNKDKYEIRRKTLREYGKLPKEFQYHHTTNPYEFDKWIGVWKEEHSTIDKIYGMRWF